MRRKIAIDTTARVRILGRRVFRVELGTTLVITTPERYWKIHIGTTTAMRTSAPPRGWSLEFGRRELNRRSAQTELWFTFNVPSKATITIIAPRGDR